MTEAYNMDCMEYMRTLPDKFFMIRIGDTVEIYRDEEFVGMFDLGALELCYVSDREGA